MYEVYQVGSKTYYIDCPAKIGIYVIEDNKVCLIDSGNDKDAGKKIYHILEEHHWDLVSIINTHSHADHIGSNHYFQDKTGCLVLSTDLENAFAKYPSLEASFLYGGFPCKELQNKFLLAKPTLSPISIEVNLPYGLEFFRLPGHFFDMIGIKTSDDVYFIADCLSGPSILEKYHLVFLYDVEAFLKTLDFIETLEGKLCIPSHAPVTNHITDFVHLNRDKIHEIIHQIQTFCGQPHSFDEILQFVFTHYSLSMDFNQYVLVGSTLRSYLSYLHNQNLLSYEFQNNILYWKATI